VSVDHIYAEASWKAAQGFEPDWGVERSCDEELPVTVHLCTALTLSLIDM